MNAANKRKATNSTYNTKMSAKTKLSRQASARKNKKLKQEQNNDDIIVNPQVYISLNL